MMRQHEAQAQLAMRRFHDLTSAARVCFRTLIRNMENQGELPISPTRMTLIDLS
jgi:hypothetical protein